MPTNRNIQALVVLLGFSFFLSAVSIPLVSAIEDFWETMEPMPTARRELGVAVVDGKIYAIGGYNGSYLSNNEMYTPAGYIPEFPSWTTMLLILIVLAVAGAIYRKKLPKTPNPQSY